MIIYHGSKDIIERPEFGKGNRKNDYGLGFYCTENVELAKVLLCYEAETGLLCMWAGLSRFLSSGDGYVGELLELQQGCEGPFGSSRD